MAPIIVDTHRTTDEAVMVLRERLMPLSLRTRFELVGQQSFTGVVERTRVRIWPIGPTGAPDGIWHQWRPVFDGRWSEREQSSHLIGEIALNPGVFVVIGICTVIVGAWLLAGVQALLLGYVGHDPLNPMLVFAGIAMPVLFALVLFGISWGSYRGYLIDRAALRTFLDGAFASG